MSYDYLYGGNLKVPPLLNALQVITTLTGFLIYFIEGFSLMQMDIFTKLRKNPKLHTILLIVVGSISITGVTLQFLTESAKLSFIVLTILQPFLALTYILILIAMLKVN